MLEDYGFQRMTKCQAIQTIDVNETKHCNLALKSWYKNSENVIFYSASDCKTVI